MSQVSGIQLLEFTRRPWPAIRLLWAAAVLIWLLAAARMLAFHVVYDPLADFRVYYDAAARLNAGELLYPPGHRSYPPLLFMALRPLAVLPFELAAVAWELALVAALAGTLWIAGVRRRATWLATAALSVGIVWTLAIGQVELLVTLLLAIGRPLTVALAANVKLYPLLAGVYWLGRRDWRRLGQLAAWTAALVALQLVAEPTNALAFPGTLTPGQVAFELGSAGNLSPFVLSPAAWVVLVVVELGVALRLARTRWAWAAAVGLAVLAPPRVFSYSLTSLLAALAGPGRNRHVDELDR